LDYLASIAACVVAALPLASARSLLAGYDMAAWRGNLS
jgi:hypothetical protein